MSAVRAAAALCVVTVALSAGVALGSSDKVPEPRRLDFAGRGAMVVGTLGAYCLPDVADTTVCAANERPRGSRRPLRVGASEVIGIATGARAESIRVRLIRKGRGDTETAVGPRLHARQADPSGQSWKVRLPRRDYGASVIDARVEYPGEHYAEFSASLRAPRPTR